MIGLDEIRRVAAQSGVGLETIEHDYVLGWVLKGIFGDSTLSSTLVFKGLTHRIAS